MELSETSELLFLGDAEVDSSAENVDLDLIAFFNDSERSAESSLRRYVTNGKSGRTAGETTVSDNCAGVEEAGMTLKLLLEGECGGTEASLEAEVTDNASITLVDVAGAESGKSVVEVIEYSCLALVAGHKVFRNCSDLDDSSLGCERTVKNVGSMAAGGIWEV